MTMNIRNPNDVMTDDVALGPSQMGQKLKSMTTYSEPGLPSPPAGWNRNLGINPKYAPDTCVVNSGTI